MNKKIFAAVLAVTLTFGAVGLPAAENNIGLTTLSASAESSSDYIYTVLENGTVEISGYVGSDREVTIPSEIDGKKVTSIATSASFNCTNLTSITIPNGVTSIGHWAFTGCTNLTSVTIPDSVTSIGFYAFGECKSLKSITIPNSVTSIEKWAFRGCTNLTSVNIPNTITSIGDSTFDACISLKSITIPNSVTSIGDAAFGRCTSLTSVTIPNSVTSIGNLAFYGCSSLISVTIPGSVTSIGDNAFDSCSSLKSVTIQNGVTSIGSGAFSDCTSLKSVTIPKSVTFIQSNPFFLCKNLKIKCYSGTIVEKYAKSFGFSYELIDKVTAPSKVNDVKVSSTNNNSAKLTWSKVKDADGYVIYRYDSTKKAFVKVASTAKNTYTVSKLKSGTAYKFVVKAYKKSGSKYVFGTKSATVTAVTNPAKPTLKATAGKKKVALKWNKVTGATGYKVYYKTSPKDAYKLLKTTKSVSLTKTGLTSGKTYYFAVKAYKTVGKITKFSDISAVKTLKVK